MLRTHAHAFQSETASVREALQPVFFADLPSEPGMDTADFDMRSVMERLVQLATRHDEQVRRAFAVSVGSGERVAVDTVEFWISLRRAEQLAARLGER